MILPLDFSEVLNIFRNYSLFYISTHYDVTSSNFLITDQKSERVLLDTILETSINYGFLENYLIFCQQA